jgi:transposase InsO family protein
MGFLYLAVVLDVFSRRIVGWSMSTTLHVTVVLDALSMALRANNHETLTDREFTLEGRGHNIRWLCAY